MERLYQTLEDSAIGLFESPTGTGKTISIICGALHWLEDFRKRAREAGAAQATGGVDDDDPDWLRLHHATAATSAPEPHPWLKRRGAVAAGGRRVLPAHSLGASSASSRRAGATGQAAAATAARAAAVPAGSNGVSAVTGGGSVDDGADDQFLLAATAAEEADGGNGGAAGAGARRRARVRALLGEDSDSGGEQAGEADDWRAALRALRAPPPPPARTPQVFFASRTHSQLAQFVSELRRTGFASRLRLVSLASRRGLCIHEPVATLGSAGLITERCTELQERSKGGSKARRTAECGKGAAGCTGAPGGGSGGCSGGSAGGCERAGPGGRGRGNRVPAASGNACPFLAPALEAAEDFAVAVLAEPMDVEDLGRTGRRLGLCPYYGSRALLPEADVVALPYSALLCEETRGSLGLRLEGSVVIFDEAHNLVDAVTSSHGSQVSLEQLGTAVRQLSAYFSRFQSRLSPSSARNVQLMVRLASALHRRLQEQQQQQQQQSSSCTGGGAEVAAAAAIETCHDFLLSMRLEHVNLFPLLNWVRECKLVAKVAGYDMASSRSESSGTKSPAPAAAVEGAVALYEQDDGEGAARGSSYGNPSPAAPFGQRPGSGAGGGVFGARRSSLFALVSFLTALTHPSADGRIVIAGNSGGGAAGDVCLRYTVLNAAAQFSPILASARSVVLTSGTLSPVEGLVAQLLPGVPRHRVRHFSCGHVVPRENLLALVAARGPTGAGLDLRHGRRADPRVIEEIGRLLINICTAVPGGVVVFAPSFAYLDQLVSSWRRSEVWARMTSRKHVFVEPRSAEVEAVLVSYSTAIQRGARPPAAGAADAGEGPVPGRRPSGAVLLSVVGGKLSEGINFGDDLGRCVVVLGLPYPNPSDPELRERMRYMDEAAAAAANAAKASSTITPRVSAAAANAARSPAAPASSSPPPPPPFPRLTGRQYYEGLCIKAVNQCVGRVIRHARDYAAVVLVDARYMPPPPGLKPCGGGVLGSLPAWVQGSLIAGNGDFAHLYCKLVGFFRARGAASAAAPAAVAAAAAAGGSAAAGGGAAAGGSA